MTKQSKNGSKKYFIVLENKGRFVGTDYSKDDHEYEGRIVRYANLKWLPINSQIRSEIGMDIRITNVEMQDNRAFSFDDLTMSDS